eukprot:TRINITY_DN180_c0_g2_i2.p1 TRINITY_DN180_c0_g2~~TRINITY_DN180_c0_g2_i2.p1  ORF type:complete len:379 (-),score=100.40 TRINITY_DN180_c0_g2_i2:447-1583(-)
METPSWNSSVQPPELVEHRGEEKAWAWLLDNFTDTDADEIMEPSRSTKRARVDDARSFDTAATALSTPNAVVSPSAAGNGMAPLFEKLATISFDAMAVEDTRSGQLRWSNQAFNELTCLVGGGDFGQGLHALKANFLQAPTYEPSRVHQVVTTAANDSVGVWSCSVLVPVSNQLYTVWVLNQSQVPPADLSQSLSGLDSCAKPAPAEPAIIMGEAADFLDVHLKVMSASGDGPQGPRVQNMWRKYGQKPLKPVNLPNGEVARTLDRLYYKCYHKECKARLLVDLDIQTQEQVNILSKGEHDHDVPILRVSMQSLGGSTTSEPQLEPQLAVPVEHQTPVYMDVTPMLKTPPSPMSPQNYEQYPLTTIRVRRSSLPLVDD